MANAKLLTLCLAVGILQAAAAGATTDQKTTTKSLEEAPATTLASTASTAVDADAPKDKRQIGAKETPLYPNHRPERIQDDPEDGQETIYGPKPGRFLIRPLSSPHQHQQHEDHQQQPQQQHLRNYPATVRPHSQQLLEQSQEIQHFAYLQDLARSHQSKAASAPAQFQGKSQSGQLKKTSRVAAQTYGAGTTIAEEDEQRYAYAVQTQVPQPQPQRQHYQQQPQTQPQPQPYQVRLQPAQSQEQQLQQQYQIIPEEQFLKIIEDELQARAYDAQLRQQQQQQTHARRQQAPPVSSEAELKQPTSVAADRSGVGLGNYRQSIAEEPSAEYVQYVPKYRGGPKYLPLPETLQSQAPEAQPTAESPHRGAQLGYYRPQVTYKSSLPNHPLAKSSLEKEIEKLLAANKPSSAAVQVVDSSNEPSAIVKQQHIGSQSPSRHQPRPLLQPKGFIGSTPNPLVDANNQPFIPSLFQFSNYQQPTPIYPTPVQVPQHVVDAKKLGPVVYPTTAPAPQPAQPTQYYYQEATPSPKPKQYRSKQYGSKISTPSPLKKENKLQLKYSSPAPFEYERRPQVQTGPVQFYPSPRDPNVQPTQVTQPSPRPTHPVPIQSEPPTNFRQYVLPSAPPSQSSIYVSQGTGISTPSRPVHKAKTVDDVKQLRLPQPGGKPLTQVEFQALVDAGYPVTAVPVPVPVPYEQYIKQNPEYRDQPADYPLMRLAQQYAPHGHLQRSLASPSEPSVKIVSSPTEPKTYLRSVGQDQKRHPREENDTSVEGKKET